MGIRLQMEYLLVEVMMLLISSDVVGISSLQLNAFFQRGMTSDNKILRYLRTASLERNIIWAMAKKMANDWSEMDSDKLRTPVFLVQAVVMMFLMAER